MRFAVLNEVTTIQGLIDALVGAASKDTALGENAVTTSMFRAC